MIQALSLDFWGTLAAYNPEYAAARTAYLAQAAGLPGADAHARYAAVKRRLDHDAEHVGTAVVPAAAFEQLIDALRPTGPMTASGLQRVIEGLARTFPPVIAARTTDILQRAAGAGLVLCLASNTNFLGGALLNELFPDLPFHGRVYSDQAGASKPHPDFFRAVISEIRHHSPRIEPADIAHIGDHAACDRDGAERAGMAAILVRSPDDTVAAVDRILGAY